VINAGPMKYYRNTANVARISSACITLAHVGPANYIEEEPALKKMREARASQIGSFRPLIISGDSTRHWAISALSS
jgi:hypothetical protein